MKPSYYFGVLVGMFFATLIVFYSFFDGYENYRHGRSIAGDIALLFAFLTWQKVSKLLYSLQDIVFNAIYGAYLDKKKEE